MNDSQLTLGFWEGGVINCNTLAVISTFVLKASKLRMQAG